MSQNNITTLSYVHAKRVTTVKIVHVNPCKKHLIHVQSFSIQYLNVL